MGLYSNFLFCNEYSFAGRLLSFGFQLPVTWLRLAFVIEKEKKTAVKLGKLLFNEKILSLDSSVSCASCHKPEFAFADTTAFSMGINNTPTLRNTPTVLNMKNRPYFFWDGRASSLNEQALMPIENPDEMGRPVAEAIKRLNESPYYKAYFKKVFGDYPNKSNLAAAFAAFENSLETVDSHFDDWGNEKAKLSESEEQILRPLCHLHRTDMLQKFAHPSV